MKRTLTALLGGALLTAAIAGCSDFLTEEGVGNDPNNPSEATRDQLLVASQSTIFAWSEGPIAQVSCMWLQACAGIGGRFVETRGRNYQITAADFSPDFSQVFIGAGLVDLRRIQSNAEEAGDRVYSGVAKVLEGYLIGMAASVWGDLPYREAAVAGEFPTPVLDPQEQVYADVQALLDEAIADLQSGEGDGPGAADLIYGGDTDAWVEAANSLKARFYMHWVEAQNAGGVHAQRAQTACGGDCVAAAIAAAGNGISSPANDMTAFHGSAGQERNIWYQFSITSFGNDLAAGSFMVNLLQSRGDPRLDDYYGQNSLGGFGGDDVNSTTPSNQVSPLGGVRLSPDFRQPMVSYEETQLILAEASFYQGGQAAAQPFLDAVRTLNGVPSGGAYPATLTNIMLEKYVVMFQNIEAWNDYKRTCIPDLDPAGTNTEVPGRLYYGQAEMNANPNIPGESDQLENGGVATGREGVDGFRNPNDPIACS
jgi:hypothetical protein